MAVWGFRYQVSMELPEGHDSLFGRRDLHHAGGGHDLRPDLQPYDEGVLRHESHRLYAEIRGDVLRGRCVLMDFKYGRRYLKLPFIPGWNQ